jgi:hypothetical protein
MTLRPSTVPMPVMMPAPGSGSGYTSCAASGLSSRKGDEGSRSAATRSRGESLGAPVPRDRHFWRAAGPPPWRAVARRSECAEMRAAECCREDWAEGEAGRKVVGRGRGVIRVGAVWGMRVRRAEGWVRGRRGRRVRERVSMVGVRW